MAEDDTTGLEVLIQQRMNRPSYTRVISWEISNSSSSPPRRSRKSRQRRKKKDLPKESEEDESEEEEDLGVSGSETDESEYFSAEEFISENQNDSEEHEGKNSESMDSSSEDISSSPEVHSISQTGQEWRRGLRSKKQKKKRRKLVKDDGIYYPDYTAPFHHEENIDFSLSDLREEIVSKTENVSARVLSLFEICSKSIWARNSRPSALGFQLLPGPLKQAVCTQRHSQAFSSLQLSIMFKNMAELESAADCEIDEKLNRLMITRNMFSKCYAGKWRGSSQIDNHLPYNTRGREGREITMVIPYSYAAFGVIDMEKPYHKFDIRTRLYKTSLMVSILDLVVPAHFQPTRKKEKAVCDQREGDHELVICADVILRNLKKRYPKVVQMCRQSALPYLYWLRGHSKLALDQFLQLSASEEDVREKACLLLEAAFLCQLQRQMEAARKLFRQSHELLVDTPLARSGSGNREEIKEQELALCANTHDQGVLTEEKAMQSLRAWQFLMTVPCSHQSAQAAAESVLCFHLSHLPGRNVREKIQLVLDHIKMCTRHCWRVSLHLSLLYAWLGDRFESISAYSRMVHGEETPGYEFKPEHMKDTEFSPWRLVYDAVSNGMTVKPLTVVWRMQLGIFRIVSSFDVFYGQLHGLHPGFRLSPEGHLTDDLHLLLPPIRALNLDLYTGNLILPSSPGHTHVQRTVFNSWHPESNHNAPDRTVVQYPIGTYVLTSTELYSDDTGRQVHLLMNRGASVLKNTYAAVTHIQFLSPSGHRKKLNLKQALKTELRKEVEKIIQHTYSRSSASKDMHKTCMKGVKYAVSHNLDFSSVNKVLHIGGLLEKIAHNKNHKTPKTRSRKTRECDPKTELKAVRLFEFEVKGFVSYGHTVCVHGNIGSEFLFSVFLDVTSKETFSHPVTWLWPPAFTNHFYVLGQQGHRVPRSDVLCIRDFYLEGYLRFYGQGGKQFQLRSRGPDNSQCVLESSVYFIENPHNEEEQAMIGTPTLMEMRFEPDSTNPQIFIHDPDPELREVKTVADRLLLVRTDGLKILNPEIMEPEPLLLHNPDSKEQCYLSDDGVTILLKPVRVSVLAEKVVLSPAGSPTVMVPVAVNDYLLVLSIQERNSVADPLIEIVFCVKVPGHTTECCLVGQTVGYVISTTFHRKHDSVFYRETLCHLSPSGQLLGLLPCLGPGPHGFFPLLLPPSPPQGGETEEGRPYQSTWHVYMRDGHEGIIAVKL